MKQTISGPKLAVALLASTALFGTAVLAGSQATSPTKAPAAKAQASAQQGMTFKVSDHAATALTGIAAARIALTNWSGDQAKSILKQVKVTLGNAKDGLNKATLVKFGGKTAPGSAKLTDSLYYPVGIASQTDTDFMPATPQKTSATASSVPAGKAETTDQVKAEQKIAANPTDSQSQGMATNPQEVVNTSVIVALLPRDATMHAIDTAIHAIDKGDFAAADIALDGVSHSILYGAMHQQASAPISS